MAIFSLSARSVRSIESLEWITLRTQAQFLSFVTLGRAAAPVHYWMPIFIVPDLSIDSRASAILAQHVPYSPRNRPVTAAVLIVTRVIGSLRLCIGIQFRPISHPSAS